MEITEFIFYAGVFAGGFLLGGIIYETWVVNDD